MRDDKEMTFRWLLPLLSVLAIPAVQAEFDITRNGASMDQTRESASQLPPHALVFSDPAGEDPLFASMAPSSETRVQEMGTCGSKGCLRGHDMAVAMAGRLPTDRAPASGANQTDLQLTEHGNLASILDIGLMALFALGLLAYPLVRKQKTLTRASGLASFISEAG